MYQILPVTHTIKFGLRLGLGLGMIRYSSFSFAITDIQVAVTDNGLVAAGGNGTMPMAHSVYAYEVLISFAWKCLSLMLVALCTHHYIRTIRLVAPSLRLVLAPIIFRWSLGCRSL